MFGRGVLTTAPPADPGRLLPWWSLDLAVIKRAIPCADSIYGEAETRACDDGPCSNADEWLISAGQPPGPCGGRPKLGPTVPFGVRQGVPESDDTTHTGMMSADLNVTREGTHSTMCSGDIAGPRAQGLVIALC